MPKFSCCALSVRWSEGLERDSNISTVLVLSLSVKQFQKRKIVTHNLSLRIRVSQHCVFESKRHQSAQLQPLRRIEVPISRTINTTTGKACLSDSKGSNCGMAQQSKAKCSVSEWGRATSVFCCRDLSFEAQCLENDRHWSRKRVALYQRHRCPRVLPGHPRRGWLNQRMRGASLPKRQRQLPRWGCHLGPNTRTGRLVGELLRPKLRFGCVPTLPNTRPAFSSRGCGVIASTHQMN